MKHTFDITINTNNRPSNNKSNNSSFIDALILSNLKNTAQYLFNTKKKKEPETKIYYFNNEKPKNNINITIKKEYIPSSGISITTFEKALKKIMSTSIDKDTYDFKLADGTPIKLFSDEIQIGYELLPINDATMYLYDKLSESSKNNIINLYIKLNK